MLVPGTFACSNASHVPLATSSRSMTEKLQAYFAWARDDPRVAGMARRERFLELIALAVSLTCKASVLQHPWHFEHQLKKGPSPCRVGLGAVSQPHSGVLRLVQCH